MEPPQESPMDRYVRATQERQEATDAVKEALEPIRRLVEVYRGQGWRAILIGHPDTTYGNPDFRANVDPFEPWEAIKNLIAKAHRAEDEEKRAYAELSIAERQVVRSPGP